VYCLSVPNNSERDPKAPQLALQSGHVKGTKWIELSFETKLGYVVGFIEGMFMGHCFSTWGLRREGAWKEATASYDGYWKKFVLKITYKKLVEGLDRLYSDEINRPLTIKDALWIVFNEISGKSKHELQSMLEASRAIAEEPESDSPFSALEGMEPKNSWKM
jgi:hypothetical protein